MFRTIRPLAALMILVALVAAAGCAASADKQKFSSTAHNPRRVAVVDTVTGEEIWAMRIPIDHYLKLWFDVEGDPAGVYISGLPADSFEWKLYALDGLMPEKIGGTSDFVASDTIELRGRPVRIEQDLLDREEAPAPDFTLEELMDVETPDTEEADQPERPASEAAEQSQDEARTSQQAEEPAQEQTGEEAAEQQQ
ncbi:MAG: hypothetical protein ACLFVN_11875 [Phycisphaeraceae bacterium]